MPVEGIVLNHAALWFYISGPCLHAFKHRRGSFIIASVYSIFTAAADGAVAVALLCSALVSQCHDQGSR